MSVTQSLILSVGLTERNAMYENQSVFELEFVTHVVLLYVTKATVLVSRKNCRHYARHKHTHAYIQYIHKHMHTVKKETALHFFSDGKKRSQHPAINFFLWGDACLNWFNACLVQRSMEAILQEHSLSIIFPLSSTDSQ